MTDASFALRCACGALRGTFLASTGNGARGICYCDDCQAFARFLAPTQVMNADGGTDVVPTWPANVTLTQGHEQLRVMRLSNEGMYRFYAGCCRSPVANCIGPRAPFAGLVASFVDTAQGPSLDAFFGKGTGLMGRFAPGGCPPGVHPRAPLAAIASAASLLARGWLKGAAKPSPFFGRDGRPVAEPQVLSADERKRLSARAA